jgi:hypothetical protein
MVLLLLAVAVSACGPRSKQQRQAYGERRADEATLLLNEAEQHLRDLDADRAVPLLEKAKEVLAHPDVELSPEAEMLHSQLADLQARVPRVREEKVRRDKESLAERERKELEASVEKQRDAVVQAMSAVTEAVDALEGRDAGKAQVDAAREAIKRTRENLKAGKELEAKSEDYAASAKRTERRLEQAEARVKLAQRVVEFVSGPLGESQQAPELEKKARREKDLAARLSLYTDMKERYQRCGDEADKLLGEVATGCRKKAVLLQRAVVKLEKAKVKQDKFKEKLEKLKAAREKKEQLKAARLAAKQASREKALARKRK